MNILFVHAAIGQFRRLHEYINEHTGATSWALCSENSWRANNETVPNLLPFADPKESNDCFFYVRRLEGRVKRSFQIKKAVLEHLNTHRIDVIVAHGSGGFPLQLYDEVPVPIVSYIEFPSFRAHGHDPKYPPHESKVFRDKVYEMGNLHQALKSQAVIVPSLHAKRMFPPILHEKIVVQMEGMLVDGGLPICPPPRRRSDEDRGKFLIGFIARDLSSAKGVEHFIMAAKEIHRHRPDCKFLICGSKKVLYSYEDDFLMSRSDIPSGTQFLDYLFQRENIDPENGFIRYVGRLSYEEAARFVYDLDLLHYPLQFGSANWGLFESMFRGKKIVASNRCFVPEVIEDGYSGLLCDYGDIDAWVRRTLEVVDDPRAFDHLGKNARNEAYGRFHVSVAAEKYLSILEKVVSDYRINGQPTEPVEPGQRPLDDPAGAAQAVAPLDARAMRGTMRRGRRSRRQRE